MEPVFMGWLKRSGSLHRPLQGKNLPVRPPLLMGLLGVLLGTGGAHAAPPPPCETLTYEDNAYTVCMVDLRSDSVRLFWKAPDGVPYGYLRELPRVSSAGRLLFATNAGMFDPDGRPVGLYVENGRELVRANTKTGRGNFHMQPNGVFYVAGQTAGVLDTTAYLKLRPRVDFATQSGPMLVINGRLHPRFAFDGASRKPRDGIGIVNPRTLAVAISDSEVSFGEFGRLFKDRLRCSNALFLDGGSVPSLYIPPERPGNLVPIGPMIGVFDKPQ
jgi:uncharacterized protein YigE (DUF2233 family)